jgi:hypothetical protein
MIWKNVSPAYSFINEEYLAIEVIRNEKETGEELGYNPWDTTGPVSLTDGLWAEFVGRCYETIGKAPRVRRHYFNRLLDTIMPDPKLMFHMPIVTNLETCTEDFIISMGYYSTYENYITYFTGKGCWKKALMTEEEFTNQSNLINSAVYDTRKS